MNTTKRKEAQPRANRLQTAQGGTLPLEQRLLESLVEPLRTTARRKKSVADTNGSQDAVEQALASPAVLSGMAKAQNAFVVEQWPWLLAKLFTAAEKGQAWAWRILLDVAGVSDQLRAACGAEARSGSKEDMALPREICALLSQTDEESEISDSAASAERGGE